jgi:hypothetical protein
MAPVAVGLPANPHPYQDAVPENEAPVAFRPSGRWHPRPWFGPSRAIRLVHSGERFDGGRRRRRSIPEPTAGGLERRQPDPGRLRSGLGNAETGLDPLPKGSQSLLPPEQSCLLPFEISALGSSVFGGLQHLSGGLHIRQERPFDEFTGRQEVRGTGRFQKDGHESTRTGSVRRVCPASEQRPSLGELGLDPKLLTKGIDEMGSGPTGRRLHAPVAVGEGGGSGCEIPSCGDRSVAGFTSFLHVVLRPRSDRGRDEERHQ